MELSILAWTLYFAQQDAGVTVPILSSWPGKGYSAPGQQLLGVEVQGGVQEPVCRWSGLQSPSGKLGWILSPS